MLHLSHECRAALFIFHSHANLDGSLGPILVQSL